MTSLTVLQTQETTTEWRERCIEFSDTSCMYAGLESHRHWAFVCAYVCVCVCAYP